MHNYFCASENDNAAKDESMMKPAQEAQVY